MVSEPYQENTTFSNIMTSTSKYPYPCNLNVANFVSLKLTTTNYLLWETQVLIIIDRESRFTWFHHRRIKATASRNTFIRRKEQNSKSRFHSMDVHKSSSESLDHRNSLRRSPGTCRSYQAEDIPQALAAMQLESVQDEEWFLDTGAIAHMTKDAGLEDKAGPNIGNKHGSLYVFNKPKIQAFFSRRFRIADEDAWHRRLGHP
uniref:Retrotransposon Copia-like N-terminal domain-containing protein n=1 Tax=Ananas comosus var. bracteatus TaxID=296719 RepID=A0A6V7Q6H2_ANACO|nr:unnamed protein product [Ananas comosus var. bracteatus]